MAWDGVTYFRFGDRQPSQARLWQDGVIILVYKRGIRYGESVDAFKARVKDNVCALADREAVRPKLRIVYFDKDCLKQHTATRTHSQT